ncbi:MAG: FeoA family protein [Endomicrobiaceae bacterium]|jgi:ferrous iron transport protein A|nr:FeoA family protein [Endomicrobiaceae bacterium]MDD4166662.1 FeoA family protein [Endomicrobiaceae bacterium]
MRKLLSDFKLNESGTVVQISSTDANLVKKILAMGITKGAGIEVVKKSILGDPINVKVRGYLLSLRKYEAAAILMEVQK